VLVFSDVPSNSSSKVHLHAPGRPSGVVPWQEALGAADAACCDVVVVAGCEVVVVVRDLVGVVVWLGEPGVVVVVVVGRGVVVVVVVVERVAAILAVVVVVEVEAERTGAAWCEAAAGAPLEGATKTAVVASTTAAAAMIVPARWPRRVESNVNMLVLPPVRPRSCCVAITILRERVPGLPRQLGLLRAFLAQRTHNGARPVRYRAASTSSAELTFSPGPGSTAIQATMPSSRIAA
jgi:hypothetical protein